MLRVRTLATIVLAAAMLVLAAPPANPATTEPVYEGRGWKVNTELGIYSLNPDPYEIVWADTTARDKLKSYFTKPAAQVKALTGVTINVTDTVDVTPNTVCPLRHRIVVSYSHRPIGLAGTSQARPCYEIANGSAWGGHILMNSEYWTTANWFSTDPVKNDAYRASAVSHELGHILGLDHPNYDKDGDGAVENYECVTTATGTRPTMCSPNGGYFNAIDSGKFTPPFDEPGLKQLIDNWYLRQG